MPRQKKKHHHRRIIKPTKGRRNQLLNQELDQAYNQFCGSTLFLVLKHLAALEGICKIAEAYHTALSAEITNRRAKKNSGAMRVKLYKEKSIHLNKLISLCQLHNFRVEKTLSNEPKGPSHILFVYLPGAEQISWHCSLGKLPIKESTEKWDGKQYSTLKKLEAGLKKEFYHSSVAS